MRRAISCYCAVREEVYINDQAEGLSESELRGRPTCMSRNQDFEGSLVKQSGKEERVPGESLHHIYYAAETKTEIDAKHAMSTYLAVLFTAIQRAKTQSRPICANRPIHPSHIVHAYRPRINVFDALLLVPSIALPVSTTETKTLGIR